MLRPIPLRKLLPAIGVAGCIKLIVQPLVAAGGAHATGLPVLGIEVLVIQTAMPSGTVVFLLTI